MSGTTGLRVYQHSGKITALGVIVPLLAAAAVAWPLGLAYAYLVRWIPLIYVNFCVTIGYGIAFGWLTARLLKWGRVRSVGAGMFIAFLVGLIALYGEWNGHGHTLLRNPPAFFFPDELLRLMQILYRDGSWSLHGSNVTGIPLAIVWVAEAVIILFFTVSLVREFLRSTPYCERAGQWLDDVKRIDTLEAITAPEKISALAAGDILPLIETKPKAEGANQYTRLILNRSVAVDAFCTVRAQDVSLTPQSDGKYKESVRDLTPMLVLPAEMFGQLAEFAEFKPVAPSPASA